MGRILRYLNVNENAYSTTKLIILQVEKGLSSSLSPGHVNAFFKFFRNAHHTAVTKKLWEEQNAQAKAI